MALAARTGTFTLNTSTGSQSVDIAGLSTADKPKVVFFWGGGLTGTGFADDYSAFLGCATSSSQEWCISAWAQDGVGTMQTDRDQSTTASIRIMQDNNADSTVEYVAVADFTSFDDDSGSGAGFTINLSTAPSAGILVHYLVLGGDGVNNAKADNWTPGGTGSRSETGVGFQGNFVLFAAINTNTSGSSVQWNLGMAAGSSQEGSLTFRDRDGTANSDLASGQETDSCLRMVSSTAGTITHEMDFTSFDSGGFTVNVTTNGANVHRYVVLDVDNVWVGADTAATSVGDQDNTNPGFDPAGLLAFSFNRAADSAISTTVDAKCTIGAADDQGNEGSYWFGSLDGTTTSDVAEHNSTTKFLTLASVPSTVDDQCDVTMITDGYRASWDTVSGTAKQYIVAAFGPAEAGGATEEFTPAGFSVSVTLGSIVLEDLDTGVTPSGIAASATFGTPTFTSTTGVTPSGIAALVTFGDIVLSANGAFPDGIAVPVTFGDPAFSVTTETTPSGISASVTFGSPVLEDLDTGVTPSGIVASATFGSITTSLDFTVEPAGIAASATFGSPALSLVSGYSPSGFAVSVSLGTFGASYAVTRITSLTLHYPDRAAVVDFSPRSKLLQYAPSGWTVIMD